MRIVRSTLIGTAVAVAIFGQNAFAADQQTTSASGATDQNLEEVVISGISYSLKESLAAKKENTNVVEVVTAEDIGKLPDKNVADVLQRVPGVNTQSAASGEGGFDENNRVALRGTSASLTQTTINGHAVATGDWFLLDQYQTVGRSVSYDLLPSEMVARTVVYKTQSADMIEGGVAGSVDLQTPKPLDFKQTFTAAATAGGVYADLPSKTEPQANAMFNWQNGTMGLFAMGFFEKRDARRDGQEVLGYGTVPAATAQAWMAANPSLPDATGAAYPTLLGQAEFTQTRKREGGAADFEIKPTDNLTLDVNGFYSHMDADNTNRNFLLFGSHFIAPNYVPTSISVGNGTLLGGTWPVIAGGSIADGAIPYNTAVYDQILRPGAASETYYVDFDATFVASDMLTLDGKAGYTHGVGDTPQQPAVESQGGNGVTYQLNGLGAPASINYTGLNVSSPAQFFTDYAFGDIAKAIDQEAYAQINAAFKVDSGIFRDVKVGARYAAHTRTEEFPEAQGCPTECGAAGLNPAFSGATYPGNYDSTLGGSGYPTNIFEYTTGQIEAFDSTALSHGPSRYYWQGAFQVKERDTAVFAMADIGGDRWSGNFGVRIVNTQEDAFTNVAGGANPITTSLFGPFTPTQVQNRYLNVLPSVNLKFELSPTLIFHTSAAETMARPDYSALGGSVTLTDLNQTGSGGNPNLRPIRSANYDASLEWYYAPQALLEVGLFYMDMASYVDFGTSNQTYFNQLLGKFTPYNITSPFNTAAEVKGAEVAWTQPLGMGFGGQANFTWSDGETEADTDMVGNSRITYNLGGYYENYGFSAHVDWTWRSHYLVGLDRSSLENQDDIGNLAASVNYAITKNLAVSFNALNLANETIKYYAANTSQPRAFYTNGRQYYFEVRFKL